MMVITPYSELKAQHPAVNYIWCTPPMEDASEARVRRLVAWLKANRRDSLNDAGEPRVEWLCQETGKTAPYWSDVLRIPRSGKSFGARAARAVEDALGIPPLHLEGAEDWPFEAVPRERFERLSPRQKGRIEEALLQALERIESETAASRKLPAAA